MQVNGACSQVSGRLRTAAQLQNQNFEGKHSNLLCEIVNWASTNNSTTLRMFFSEVSATEFSRPYFLVSVCLGLRPPPSSAFDLCWEKQADSAWIHFGTQCKSPRPFSNFANFSMLSSKLLNKVLLMQGHFTTTTTAPQILWFSSIAAEILCYSSTSIRHCETAVCLSDTELSWQLDKPCFSI